MEKECWLPLELWYRVILFSACPPSPSVSLASTCLQLRSLVSQKKLMNAAACEKEEGVKRLPNGKKHGLYEKYWNHTGERRVIRWYFKGLKDGTSFEFYSDGSLARKIEYRMGIESGEYILYDSEGDLVRYKLTTPPSALINHLFS